MASWPAAAEMTMLTKWPVNAVAAAIVMIYRLQNAEAVLWPGNLSETAQWNLSPAVAHAEAVPKYCGWLSIMSILLSISFLVSALWAKLFCISLISFDGGVTGSPLMFCDIYCCVDDVWWWYICDHCCWPLFWSGVWTCYIVGADDSCRWWWCLLTVSPLPTTHFVADIFRLAPISQWLWPDCAVFTRGRGWLPFSDLNMFGLLGSAGSWLDVVNNAMAGHQYIHLQCRLAFCMASMTYL